MKVVRTVFNGGHEETYGNATRLVPTQLIDELVLVARQRPIATGRVRVERTACLHCNVGSLLDRLHREIFGRLEDDRPVATDPGDNRGPVFVIVPPPGLTLLAATPCAVSQRFLPTLFRLTLLSSDMIELIGFDRAFQLTLHLIRQRGIAQPPAPSITGADMHPHLASDAPR